MAIKKFTFIGKHNKRFRVISNQQITTVEISPTGSGKTHFYRQSPNTIMLMPTNALVRQQGGMLSEAEAKAGERSKWDELDTSKCDYMTYDKFYGHSRHENMSDLNIIIDEAHLILASMNEVHYKLLEALFTRNFAYRELKLISATLRPEILDIYDYRPNEPLQIKQYVSSELDPTIQFTTRLPDLSYGNGHLKRTLFFINSKDKMIQVKEFYEKKYPNIIVHLISADNPVLPHIFSCVTINLYIATSAIKQGFSFNMHLDQVVIHNVYNPVGAMDIIQYMSRPRLNQPEIFVIPATTHFRIKKSNLFDMPEIALMLEHVATDGNLTTQQYHANTALVMDEFLARAKTSKEGWNILGVTSYYEKLITYHELHLEGATHMMDSIKTVIPNATVIWADLLDGHELNFTILKLTDADKKILADSANIKELVDNINLVKNSTTEARILEKMDKYLKAAKSIVADFRFSPNSKEAVKGYKFDNKCQVAQVLDENVRKQCKQHVENIKKKVYDYRDTNLRYAPNLGERIPLTKLGRKLNFLKKYFAVMDNNLELLGKIYCFKRYDEKGVEITSRSRSKVHEVEITSMYCVETSWYYKTNKFLTVGQVGKVI